MAIPKLDDKTVNALNGFFDELDGKPAQSVSYADKLKKALQNVGSNDPTRQPMLMYTNPSSATIQNQSFVTSSITGTPTTQSGPTGAMGTWPGNTNYASIQSHLCWRMVTGMITDEDTGQQKYITKAYFCLNRAEAELNFTTEYPNKKFTAIFVMDPVEGE